MWPYVGGRVGGCGHMWVDGLVGVAVCGWAGRCVWPYMGGWVSGCGRM